ncbi:hypothetical protein [Allobacillus halotolerans]|uniref:DUF4030 domain-containing protein n=1 Tax=Allobacillus halotolerans TaxID=570278 RepID=A0ABS6GRA9_9BACI|nr:hypothetical protein [Allobacillus halotolerans]MBU6081446.1 hypothetical protein [Allobacillus halotolerans]
MLKGGGRIKNEKKHHHFNRNFFVVGLGSTFLFNQTIISSTNEEVKDSELIPSSDETNKEISRILQKIKAELQPNYNIAVIKTKYPSNTIVVEVKGSQKYLTSVEKDIENSVKKLIEGTILNEHLISVTKYVSSFKERERLNEIHSELLAITETLLKELQVFDEVIDIKSQYQKSITIETKIKGTDQYVQSKMKEIEKEVKELLNTQKFNSISKIQGYDVSVKNVDN